MNIEKIRGLPKGKTKELTRGIPNRFPYFDWILNDEWNRVTPAQLKGQELKGGPERGAAQESVFSLTSAKYFCQHEGETVLRKLTGLRILAF